MVSISPGVVIRQTKLRKLPAIPTQTVTGTGQGAAQATMATWAKDELDLAVGRQASQLDAASLGIGRRLKSGKMSSASSAGADPDLNAWVARHPLGTLCSTYAQVLVNKRPRFGSKYCCTTQVSSLIRASAEANEADRPACESSAQAKQQSCVRRR